MIPIESAALLTALLPSSISLRAPSISALVSTADCALWSARTLICSATTANPLPASPALAASIAALSERRLVCEAMFSISAIMLLIFNDVSLILSIASISDFMDALLSSAFSAYSWALLLLSISALAVSATFSEIVVIVAWSSSTAPACSVAPSASSCADCARFSEPAVTDFEASSTLCRVSFTLSFIILTESLSSTNLPTYFSPFSVSTLKLPFAISDIISLKSVIMRLSVAAIDLASSVINDISSSWLLVGNSLSRSPLANVLNLSTNALTGSSTDLDTLLLIFFDIIELITITTRTPAQSKYLIIARIFSSFSPLSTLISISLLIAL